MLPNILQIIGLCPHHRIIQLKMSVVLSLRNPVLEQCLAYNRSSINTAEQIFGLIQQVLIEHLLCQILPASTKENQVWSFCKCVHIQQKERFPRNTEQVMAGKETYFINRYKHSQGF